VRPLVTAMKKALVNLFGHVVKYAVPILLPLFALVSWLFLR